MSAPADAVLSLKNQFPQVSERPSLDHPAINVPVADLLSVLGSLKTEHGYDVLVDVTAIDASLGTSPRFTTVYHLYSSVGHGYVRVATSCASDTEPSAPSATGLWPAANWHERETFDMFGIVFDGHPDLRRILMWDGYPYFPLRKEFPLAGIDAPLPDPDVVAETGVKAQPAPMMGGPFVASPGEMNLTEAEPRAKDESWNERREKRD